MLQNNHKAINLYRKMEFETTRKFDCFRQSIAEIRNPKPNGSDTAIRIGKIDADAVKESTAFCDFIPSWQNITPL